MNPLPAAEPPSHSTGHTDPQSNDAPIAIDAQLLESLTKQIQESQSHGLGMRLDPGEEEILDTAQEVISQFLSSDQSQTLLSLLQHSGKGSDLDHEMHHHHHEELTLEQQQQQQQTLQETLSLLLLKDQQSQQQMHDHHHELVEEDEQERLSSAVHAAVAALQEGLAGSGQDLSATQSMIASSSAPGGEIVDPNLPAAALYQSLVLQLCQAALQTSSMDQSAQSDASPAYHWASALNAMTSSNLVTPPISHPSSPVQDSDDFVVVTKRPKSLLPNDKHRRRKMGPDGPMMEQMSEEATEQEQQMLHEAIANAVTVSDPESFKREMRYECPACRRPFTRLYNLKSHIRSHQNYRPFKCSQCTASFTRNHDLNRYVLTLDLFILIDTNVPTTMPNLMPVNIVASILLAKTPCVVMNAWILRVKRRIVLWTHLFHWIIQIIQTIKRIRVWDLQVAWRHQGFMIFRLEKWNSI